LLPKNLDTNKKNKLRLQLDTATNYKIAANKLFRKNKYKEALDEYLAVILLLIISIGFRASRGKSG